MALAGTQTRFGSSTPFRVGVEEELFSVDPRTLAITPGVDAILGAARFCGGHGCGEISDGMIELVSEVCDGGPGGAAALRALRAQAVEAGATLLAAGLHPTHAFGDVVHRTGGRYDYVSHSTRSLLRQTPHCGLHVHVGMPDAETAIRVCNGLRKWIPLLQALGANSPFWHGRDSGLASARSVICRSLPRSGVPRHFHGYEDFAACADDICAAGEIDDYTYFWWDIRPHPRVGTVEIRAIDVQASLRDLEGLVTLVHGLADRLIAACAERAKAGGAAVLTWQTAADNLRAQAVYERVGVARDDRWLDYELELA
jgi:glutamate---cysteine ligase / carboxylate-amine ligase